MSKIIVGVDGPQRTEGALALASILASRTGAEIVLARAYRDAARGPLPGRLPDGGGTQARGEVRHGAVTGTEPMVVSVNGQGPDALVALADELEATLLVLGNRSLAGLRALASVSERVGARARCPVLVMRDQASADARFASCSSG